MKLSFLLLLIAISWTWSTEATSSDQRSFDHHNHLASASRSSGNRAPTAASSSLHNQSLTRAVAPRPRQTISQPFSRLDNRPHRGPNPPLIGGPMPSTTRDGTLSGSNFNRTGTFKR